MLISFSVSNFLSFNERTTFSMESGRATKKESHLLPLESNAKPLLKFAAMFGKNGAGKTNFVRSIAVLQSFVVKGTLPRNAPNMWCKVQDGNETLPTEFEIKFCVEKEIYIYKIAVTLATGLISEESLIHQVGNRKTALFKKESQDADYSFHHSIKGTKGDIEVLSRSFDLSGKPFLFSINHNTAGFYRANPESLVLSKVFLWFKDTLEVIFPDQPIQETSLLRYDVCKDRFAALLKDFDTGIEEIRLERVSKEKAFENLDLRTQQKLNLEMNMLLPFIEIPAKLANQNLLEQQNLYSSVIRNRRNIFIITYEKDMQFHYYALKFVHKIGQKEIEFNMESESDGTHRLFQLLEILVSQKEKVYVFDEISRSLHPKLTVQFVKKYFSSIIGRNIQLITTTHESRLLSHDLVRRDEIWICDEHDDKSTNLYSLEDKQVRIDKVLDQNYMENVWGGVPVFEEEE